jgi:hypothetical protein
MPSAQKYGIMFGILTFVLTVIAVLSLLTFGGTWKRIEEQAKYGASATAPDSITQRKNRALLMERLLESREWMLKTNYPNAGKGKGDEFTPLTTMLMMEAPIKGKITKVYEENYKAAYRRCQDKPGGEVFNKYPLLVLSTSNLLINTFLSCNNDAITTIRTNTRRSSRSPFRNLRSCIC